MLTAVGLQQFDPFFTSTMLSIAITLYDNNKCLQLITRLRIQNSVSDLAVPPALLIATFPHCQSPLLFQLPDPFAWPTPEKLSQLSQKQVFAKWLTSSEVYYEACSSIALFPANMAESRKQQGFTVAGTAFRKERVHLWAIIVNASKYLGIQCI